MGGGRLAQRDRPPRGDDHLDRIRTAACGQTLEPGSGAVARLIATTATSAGGIVIRFVGNSPQFVAGRRKRERDGMTWTLPKGTPVPGETLEETALREVAEETGLQVRVLAPLDSIRYTFVQRGTRIRKTVHYFLMEPVGGSLEDHDHEFEEVRWVAFDDAPGLLSFETERALVGLAAGRLPDLRGATG
jgi:8-oxo-dGTP pyrophosphatase MutT (NUDIX family)